MMSTRGSSLPSIETRDLTSGKIFVVYRNGDPHFSGKKYVLNPRSVPNFDAFLDDVKKYVPNETAIRRIYTPNGGSRITDYSQLESDKQYVCAGKERFKRLNYTQIESYSPRRKHRQLREERLIPAHHNKYLENVTGKIHQIPTQGKAIEVFVNGQDIDKPTTVGISYKQLESLDEAIKAVHEAIKEKHQYRVDQLCDLEGHVLTDVNEIQAGGLYVAKKFYEKFHPGRYEPHGRKNIIVPLSPRDKPPKYLWKERTLPPINQKKHSPDHSVSSYPETRKRNQVNGVPMKPAKHTKKTTKQADYDKDEGGVFKAKGQNRDTRGAREDERIRREKQGKDVNTKTTKPADHSHSKTMPQGDRSQGKVNGEPSKNGVNNSQSKNSVNNSQSKANVNNSNAQNNTVQNGKNSTYKSNSKAPPPDQSQNKAPVKANDTKNNVKKDEPPKQDRNDPVRSSTPKDANKATSSPTKDNKVPTPAEEHQAATKIQANYRGHQARKEVDDLKKKKELEADAAQKKKEDQAKALQAKQENEAATKIQAGFRGHQARKEVKEKKQVRDVQNSKEEVAATKIQSGFKGHKARQEVEDKKVQRTEKNLEEEAAATKIQAGFRGHKARMEINQKKEARNNRLNDEEKAATKIQAGFRGHKARHEVIVKKQEKARHEEEERAATKIQAGFRGHQARKEVQKKKTKKLDGKSDAITVIQAAARGFLVRRRIQKRESTKMLLQLRSAAQEEVMDILGLIHERDKAATTIQSRYRGYRDRKEYKRKKVNQQREVSLTFLQANFRAFLARKDINKRLLMELRKLDTPVNRQGYFDSIDKVQASFHGYLFRKVAFEKLHQILIKKDAVTVLQASVKAYLERWHIKRRNLAALAHYHMASTELQGLFKSYLTRRKISQDISRRASAASKIQAGVRGYSARKGYLQQKQAVTRIQSGYRGYRARQQRDQLVKERRNSAATIIQSNFRGFKVRNRFKLETRHQAFEQIHASFRGFLLRKEIYDKIKHIKEKEIEHAAVKIQTKFRGYSDRLKFDVIKRNRVNELRKINAATEIQAQFRGYLTRKHMNIRPTELVRTLHKPKLNDNSPLFVEGTAVRFDLQTTGSISPVRPRTGRLQASLSNVNREQTYIINNDFVNTNDHNQFKSMTRSTTAHIDSFSHLQESFRSLLARRRKSNKPSQQLFHERTRFISASHLQASFRGFLTRKIITRMCQYDREPSTLGNLSVKHPSPVPLLKNPDEIRVSGSYEDPRPQVQDQIMPNFDYIGEVRTREVDILTEFPYHRQYSRDKSVDVGKKDSEVPVQYVLRSRTNSSNKLKHSNPLSEQLPVQYLYRSRESTRHQTPHKTARTDRSRFDEPSPPIQSSLSPVMHSGQNKNFGLSTVDSKSQRYEEPSPTEMNTTLEWNRHRYEKPSPTIQNPDLNVEVTTKSHRYEEPSPFEKRDGPAEHLTNDISPNIVDTSDSIYVSTRNRYEEPSPLVNSDTDPNHLQTHRSRFEEPSPVASDPAVIDIKYPTSPRDKPHDLPDAATFRQNQSPVTNDSNESEMSIETFSRKLVNEIESNALLKDEALLILQAAFRGFLLRNLTCSQRLEKLSKMDTGDKTMFDETAVPFLQAGFRGYLSSKRDVASPHEM